MKALRSLVATGAAVLLVLAATVPADAQVRFNRGINPWTGRVYRNVAVRNPWTGRVGGFYSTRNPWTGARVRGGTVFNPWTGRGVAFNPWTGRYHWGPGPWGW